MISTASQRAEPDHSAERSRPQPPGRRLLRPAAAAESRAVPDLRSVDDTAGSGAAGARHPRSVSEQHHPREPDRQSALQALHGIPAEPEPESARRRISSRSTTSTTPPSQTRSEATCAASASISTIRSGIDSSDGSAAATSPKARETGRTKARPGLHALSRVRKTWAGTGNWTRVQGDTVIDGQIGVNRFLRNGSAPGTEGVHAQRDRFTGLHGRVLPGARRLRRRHGVPVAADQLRRDQQQLLPGASRQLRDVRPGHALPGAS